MAVNTTVEVVMPPMGDSVSEGSILEWHKQEGDEVSEDETLVEISTDKVDAEVPSPVSGTVVKIHAAEGDTVGVGSVLAEIAPEPTAPGPRSMSRRTNRRPAAEGKTIEIEMPAMGESVSEGTILEWAKQPGDAIEVDETIVEISTDKVDAEVPAPSAGTLTEILADAGDTVTVGQVIARMTTANGAKPASRRRPSRPRSVPPATSETVETPGRREGHAGRRARRRRHGRRPRQGQGTGPNGRIGKADVLAYSENGARRTAAPAPRRPAQADPAQGRERDARALHGRVAGDPDRHVLPHHHRHRRSTPAASSSRPRATRSPSRT